VFELPEGMRGLRPACNCCGCGGRLFRDRAVTWDELDESLSDGSIFCACPGLSPGELSGWGEKAPGRL
jgi:hypothetical protein